MARIRRHRRDTVQSPLETYLREINETALLTADEEKMLARRISDGDRTARDRMVRANLRLVVNIARGYVGKGLALQDLIRRTGVEVDYRFKLESIDLWETVVISNNKSSLAPPAPRIQGAIDQIPQVGAARQEVAA